MMVDNGKMDEYGSCGPTSIYLEVSINGGTPKMIGL